MNLNLSRALKCAAIVLVCNAGVAQTTTLVSLASNGAQGNGSMGRSAISADGRYVAFESTASNLVPGDTNGLDDVFVRDLALGTTTRVSVSSTGTEGNNSSSAPAISADGRHVAFHSDATNLVPGDTNFASDIFVHDMLTGATTRVSVDSNGAQTTLYAEYPTITPDGRFVAYTASGRVMVRDTLNGTTTQADLTTSGQSPMFGLSDLESISADGRYVAFDSYTNNLVQGDVNGAGDVFVRDMVTHTTALVSVSSSGVQGTLDSLGGSICADGHLVAFVSRADLVPGDTNGIQDIFVHDMITGATTRVSVSSSGAQDDASTQSYPRPVISADGRYVTFASEGTTLVPNDTNAVTDVFLHDRATHTTTRISIGTAGTQSNDESVLPSISGDGRFVSFTSFGSNLVPLDTNSAGDVFVRDTWSTSSTLCSGDGTGTPCPCGNSGGHDNGCSNSIFAGGGHLASSGWASVASDSFALVGSQMPNAAVLYFQGNASLNGGLGAAFGDGLRCAGGLVSRLGTEINASNGSTYPAAGDVPISTKGAIPSVGGMRVYQAWYRNTNGPCGSAFNLTNGLQVTWVP